MEKTHASREVGPSGGDHWLSLRTQHDHRGADMTSATKRSKGRQPTTDLEVGYVGLGRG